MYGIVNILLIKVCIRKFGGPIRFCKALKLGFTITRCLLSVPLWKNKRNCCFHKTILSQLLNRLMNSLALLGRWFYWLLKLYYAGSRNHPPPCMKSIRCLPAISLLRFLWISDLRSLQFISYFEFYGLE